MPELTVIARNLRFPEGPVWLPDGSLLVVEIARRTLTRIGPDGEMSIVAELGGGPNGAAIGPDGACYVCNNGGFEFLEDEHGLRPVLQARDYSGGRIERVDLKTGETRVLYTHSTHGPLKGPNDIVFDKQGGFYFSDLGKVRARDRDIGAVHYARIDGSHIEEVVFPILTPNGVGLSPDERVLYVAETETARLWAFDIESPGKLSKQGYPSPHGGRLVCGVGGYQRFDSLAIDSAGNICVATLVNGGITVIAPDGSAVEHIPLPDRMTTNICFGGKDRATAFVTLSLSGRLASFPWPRPGLTLNFSEMA